MLMFLNMCMMYFLHRFNQFDFLPLCFHSSDFLGKLTSFCECNIVT